MFRRPLFCILPIIAFLIFSGCSALDFVLGKKEEEPPGAKMSRMEMHNRINELEQEIQKMQYEQEVKLARENDEKRLLKQKVRELEEQNQRLTDRNSFLEGQFTQRRSDTTMPQAPPKVEKKEAPLKPTKMKIKVLSGDGTMSSAKKMVGELKKKGYKAKSIGLAPRSNFLNHTVYFAPKFRKDAENIVSLFGTRMMLKPLTWPSEFDIIIVTGKN